MDFDKLPTDNLYKVLAIGGLALTVTAFFWPFQIGYQIQDEIAPILRQQASRVVTVEVLIADGRVKAGDKSQWRALPTSSFNTSDGSIRDDIRKSLSTNYQTFTAAILDSTDSKNSEAVKKKLREKGVDLSTVPEKTIRESVDEVLPEDIAKMRQARDDMFQILNDLEIVWRKMDYAATCQRYGRVGIVVGAILTVVGFALWYFKLQRYHDAAAKREAAKAI
ncbi:MAG TPA: hypothetical protein VHD36_12145 [Pirellulales bacterium]|nr:hypothetical protein [Pirellulales bacterium]